MEKITENKQNITRACLQLNDKVYPVHEGHNTVGRNPDALINIKNLNVSKTHAVITVLDRDSHFLSDFKSANGTFLDSKQLSPLQLYKLDSGASVKFGDVVCTYKKLDDGMSFRKSLAESQAYSDSFYATSTQDVHFPNLPEGINFNELPTQIFTAADLGINEMPTQMHNFDELDSSDGSIDYMTMQKALETQTFGNKSEDDKVQPVPKDDTKRSEVDHVEVTVQAVSNSKGVVDSETDDDLTQESVIRPLVQNSKKITDSQSSETDDDLMPSGLINPVKKAGKNAIESESDTDDDLQNNKSKYHISDDSETDVGENEEEKDENDIVELPRNSQENPVETIRLAAGADKNEECGLVSRMSKKILPQDHLYCQALSQTQDHFEKNEERLSLEKKEGEQCEEDNNAIRVLIETVEEQGKESRTESLENPIKEGSQGESDEESQNQKDNEKCTDSREQNSHSPKMAGPESGKDSQETSSLPMHQHSEGDNKDVCDTTSQSINFNFLSEDNRSPDESRCRSPLEKEKDCGTRDLSQKDDDLNQKRTAEDKNQEEADNLNHKDENKEEKEEETVLSGETSRKDDDIYLQPTQTLNLFTETKEENPPVDENKQKKKEKILRFGETSIRDDDIYLQPTQTLAFAKGTKENSPPEDDFFGDDDDEIFMQPTQVLVNSLSASTNSPATKPSEENDVFLRPTTAKENMRDKVPMLGFIEEQDETQELDEDDFLPPTQAMERLHGVDKVDETEKSLTEKRDNVDIFSPETQTLESLLSEDLHSTPQKSVFLQPNPSPLRKSARRKIIPERSPSREEEDSFIFQPTQALEELHDDGTPFSKVEDQLHEIFASQSMLCTQQLVDVLNSSKDDVIEDSMLLDQNMKGLTEMTVKEILEDGEDLVVNRSLKKKEVKTYSKKKNEEQDEDCEPSTSAGRGDDGKGKSVSKKGKRKPDPKDNSEKKEEVVKEESKSGDVKGKKKGKGKQENQAGAADKQEVIVGTDESKEGGGANKKKGKGKRNLEDQHDKEQGSKIEDNKESSSGTAKRGRRKQNLDVREEQKENATDPDEKERVSKTEANKESTSSSTKRGRRKQNMEVREERKENVDDQDERDLQRSENTDDKDVQSSSNITEKTTRRSRRKQNLDVSSERKPKVDDLNEDDSEEPELEEGKEFQSSKKDIRRGRRRRNLDVSGEREQETENQKERAEVQDDKDSESSTASNKSSTKRGRRKQTVSVSDEGKQKADDQNENDVQGSKSESQGSCSSEKGLRKSRRKQNLDVTEQPDSNFETAGTSSFAKAVDEADGTERRGRGKWRQTLEAIEEVKPSVGPSTSKRGRQPNVEKETPNKLKRTRATLEVLQENQQEPSKKLRKKTASDEPPETPTKKKVVSPDSKKTPKKRSLKLPSDSEDEFEPKVPKIIGSPSRLRSAKKGKGEDTLSSTSTDQQTEVSIASASSEPTGRTRRLSANSKRQKKEQETMKKMVTPERSRRVIKPKVVFTMLDNPELESLIRQLGGSVVDTVDSCTVLVTGSVKRSQKLLCAVAQGKPICSPQWLYACKKAFAFVDPWEYLLMDKEAEKKWNFSLRESLSRASKAKLLQDYTFQIIVSKGNDTEKVLKGAIEACGGKCVAKNLAKAESKYLFIVSNENQKASYNRVAKQNPNIKVVQAEAIFDGTLRQEFRFNEFSLS